MGRAGSEGSLVAVGCSTAGWVEVATGGSVGWLVMPEVGLVVVHAIRVNSNAVNKTESLWIDDIIFSVKN